MKTSLFVRAGVFSLALLSTSPAWALSCDEIMNMVNVNVPANIIVRQLRKGYRQHVRVLRYAEVVVSRAPEPIAQEEKLQTL